MTWGGKKGQFTSKSEGMSRAKRVHVCTACLHNQTATFTTCPACQVNGMRVYFPSSAEHLRAVELITLFKYGKIGTLKFHPRFDLIVNGRKICAYEADASYIDLRTMKTVIEDTKPFGDFMDAIAELKISLFNALNQKHSLEVTLIRRKN